MVLPNSSVSSSDGGFDDSPPNDADAFGSSGGDSSGAYISGASAVADPALPQPCPGMGLFGYTHENLAKLVDMRIQQASKVMRRPTTQDEATSLAYWTAKQISIISYGAPLGVGAGLYRAYQTAPEFRFPFLRPDPAKFNADAFPTAKMNLFQGARSRMAWHALRSAAYGAGGNFIGSLLFASYAMSVVAVGELSDKRLKDYVQAMKDIAGKTQQAMREKAGTLPPNQNGGSQSMPMGGSRTPPSRVEEVDDASPTGGAFWEENDNDLADKGWKSANDPRREMAAKMDAASARKNEATTDDRDPSSKSSRAQFDDASPASDVSMQDGPQSDGGGSESAWERLRRQNAAARGPSSSNYGDRKD